MVDTCLNGLTQRYRSRVNESGVVDFDQLQPTDVTRQLDDGLLGIDWSNVIFIKNFRQRGARVDSIVWSNTEGFYRTQSAPGMALKSLTATRVVGWHDMKLMVKFLELSGPAPFVIGRIMLISTERPQKAGHTSWLGSQFITHIAYAGQVNHVHLMLRNGLSLNIQDTLARLTKKIDEARQILALQQRIQRFVAQQHGLAILQTGAFQPVDALALEFLDFRDMYLLELIQRKSGYQTSLADRQKFLREIYLGDRQPWHLDDERGDISV